VLGQGASFGCLTTAMSLYEGSLSVLQAHKGHQARKVSKGHQAHQASKGHQARKALLCVPLRCVAVGPVRLGVVVLAVKLLVRCRALPLQGAL
jgi:hypothetical protein